MRPLHQGSSLQLYGLLAIALVAAITPFASVLGGLYDVWNLKPEYSHGIIIPILSAFLIWRQRQELRALPFTGSWYGLTLIAAGLALRLLGELTTMHTLEHYAFLLVLYGLVLSLTGPKVFGRLWMPLLILVFALPLPSLIDSALSLHLQLLSSAIGVAVIRAAGISVLLEGNVIDLGNYQLEVAEACSGLRYLYPLMTLAFIIAYLFRGPSWKRAATFLSSVPITIAMNSLRIGFVGITVEYWGLKMAEGVLHEFEGWLIFMLSIGAVVLVAMGLAKLGRSPAVASTGHAVPTADIAPAANAIPPSVNLTQRPSTGTQAIPRPFTAAVAIVIVGAVASVGAPAPEVTTPPRDSFANYPLEMREWTGQREALEPIYLDRLRLDDYVLANYRRRDGAVVNFYAAYYESQDSTRAVHSPHDCLPGGGWLMQKLEQRPFPGAGAKSFAANRAIIQLGANRQIVYYWFDERGRHLTNEYAVRWYLFWDALTRHRTDGSLVRFVAPLPQGVSEATVDAQIQSLGARIVPTLERYIPH